MEGSKSGGRDVLFYSCFDPLTIIFCREYIGTGGSTDYFAAFQIANYSTKSCSDFRDANISTHQFDDFRSADFSTNKIAY